MNTWSRGQAVPAARRGLLICTGLLAGIAHAQPATPREETLIAWLATNPSTLCYWLDRRDAYTLRFSDIIAESLAQRDYETPDRWIPRLAERFEVGPDRRTFTFHLRKGVKFHDGTLFTADDVLFAFESLRNPKLECSKWAKALADLDGTPRKLDEQTIVFRWKTPYFKAFEVIATVPIFPAAALRFSPGGEDQFNNNQFHRQIIGTGPYKFAEWTQNDKLVLRRNDDYWGEKPQVAEIRYLIVKDPEAAFQMFLKGDIDVCQLSPKQWENLHANPALLATFGTERIARMASFQIYWNNRRAPLNDARVRRALSHLVPRPRFIKNVLGSFAEPVTGPFFFKSPAYNVDLPPIELSQETAANLLAAAGWEDHDGDGFLDQNERRLEVTLLHAAGVSTWRDFGDLFKEELATAGIVLNVLPVEWNTLLSRAESHDFDGYVTGGTYDWDVDAYENWHSDLIDRGGNVTGYRNPAVDELILQARQTLDSAERASLNRRIHQLIYEDQPCTFLHTPIDLWAWNKRYNIRFYNYYPSSDLRRVTINREPAK